MKSIVFESTLDRATFYGSTAFGRTEVMHAHFRDFAFKPHTHDELIIGVMYSGVKGFKRNRFFHQAGKHSVSINNAGDVHTGMCMYEDEIRYSGIYLNTNALASLGLPKDFALSKAVLNDTEIWRYFSIATNSIDDRLLFEQSISEGIWLINERYEQQNIRPVRSANIRDVMDYINDNITENVSLVQLSSIAKLSTRQLIRNFKSQLSFTPHQYVINSRVNRAKALLKQNLDVSYVSSAVGFSDQAHLTKTFLSLLGTTPGQYKNALQAG